MDRDALEKLIAAVEAGKRPWREAGETDTPYAEGILLAFNGSLDAAEALHEALVPGWVVQNIGQDGFGTGCGWTVWICHHDYLENFTSFTGSANTPSRAWMLAQLKAKLAEVS